MDVRSRQQNLGFGYSTLISSENKAAVGRIARQMVLAAKSKGEPVSVMVARGGMMGELGLIVGTKENAPIIDAFHSTKKCYKNGECEENVPVNDMLDKIYGVIKNSINATLPV